MFGRTRLTRYRARAPRRRSQTCVHGLVAQRNVAVTKQPRQARKGSVALLAAVLGVSTSAAGAQEAASASPTSPTIVTTPGVLPDVARARPSGSYVEAGGDLARLSGDNPRWSGQYVKGVWQPYDHSTWYGEIANLHRYGDHGVLYSLGENEVFDPDWYGSLFAGTSSGGFFLPRYRLDGFLNRKWLPARNLVTTLGLGFERAKDVHTDRRLFLGAAYYFPVPWILEGGLRLNLSHPGSVRAVRSFFALTQGRDGHHYVIFRFEGGREAYQLLGDQAVLSNFPSHVGSLAWRQWLSPSAGFQLRTERYRNPYYTRTGIEVAVFHAF